jgi:low affinity Fe/Cu permease
MVFLIQNAHSRDTRAMNLKLDELVRASERASRQVVSAEQLSDRDLEALCTLARSGSWPPHGAPSAFPATACTYEPTETATALEEK